MNDLQRYSLSKSKKEEKERKKLSKKIMKNFSSCLYLKKNKNITRGEAKRTRSFLEKCKIFPCLC